MGHPFEASNLVLLISCLIYEGVDYLNSLSLVSI